MTLKEQISTDFMTAYKAKDMTKKNFLGVLKGAIQTQETQLVGGKLVESTDENVLKIVKKFEKNINEVMDAKKRLGNSTEDEVLELTYLQPYLPVLMGEDEIRSVITEILARPDVNKNQGFLMGTFNKEQKGKSFDNKAVGKIIQEQLSA
jgi:uncharacterized protein YqeY